MEKLGRNHGGYFGDAIDIEAVLADIGSLAMERGWRSEPLTVSGELELITLHRQIPNPTANFYLSAGIHGDEPAGPLAVRELLATTEWPENVACWLCPCLNPEGYKLKRRENEAGVDLNRDYKHLRSAAVRAHVAWLGRLPRFDLTLSLHEDWESNGFYLYELNPDGLPSFAEAIVSEVSRVCPVDLSPEIEGRAASGGIIRPSVDPHSRPDWPEAFYLLQHKGRRSYTLEAPSDFPLPVRVAALAAAVNTVLARLSGKDRLA